MSAAAREAVLRGYCRELKTPTLFREHAGLARQARDGGWDYEDFLVQLLEAEVQARREHTAARRLREARFPEPKTFDTFDWNALEGISRPKLNELARCEYIERAEDVVLAGPIGTGKTHIAIALGVEAARRRYRVVFARAAELVRELIEARDERALGRLHQRYARVALLIVDLCGAHSYVKCLLQSSSGDGVAPAQLHITDASGLACFLRFIRGGGTHVAHAFPKDSSPL
ncbi:MAG: ATP-binding protein [Desulfuromonadales bacterium]|nr:ATP-binding protein [Gammaproteobacteria bacterium]NIR34234.1 ATP-binding protein [Desulfuromonadales bacterium]NIR82350.1 ATP-binding protein [Gammaproteobacteria bacterium]NIU03503.1 ATP-binding protein [Gammaproteobacteria bacterium]NIV50907.1 ATP-binding protein [Gammaproteobacteria bacterium]